MAVKRPPPKAPQPPRNTRNGSADRAGHNRQVTAFISPFVPNRQAFVEQSTVQVDPLSLYLCDIRRLR